MTPTWRRSAPATKAAILEAARVRFGDKGFDRVTLRDIAGDVGVDPALVIRYFGSKEKLFASASEFHLGLPDLTGVTADQLAELLVPRFIAIWEGDGGFLSLLRASTTNAAAAAKMREVFAQQVRPALAVVAVDRPDERAALVGAQMLGLALSRYVLQVQPLADLSPEELRDWLAPVLRHYLTEQELGHRPR